MWDSKFVSSADKFAGVAQLVERHVANVNVAGSSPVSRSQKERVPFGARSFFWSGGLELGAAGEAMRASESSL